MACIDQPLLTYFADQRAIMEKGRHVGVSLYTQSFSPGEAATVGRSILTRRIARQGPAPKEETLHNTMVNYQLLPAGHCRLHRERENQRQHLRWHRVCRGALRRRGHRGHLACRHHRLRHHRRGHYRPRLHCQNCRHDLHLGLVEILPCKAWSACGSGLWT